MHKKISPKKNPHMKIALINNTLKKIQTKKIPKKPPENQLEIQGN